MLVKDHFALEAVVFGAVDLDVVLDMNSRSILFISIRINYVLVKNSVYFQQHHNLRTPE